MPEIAPLWPSLPTLLDLHNRFASGSYVRITLRTYP